VFLKYVNTKLIGMKFGLSFLLNIRAINEINKEKVLKIAVIISALVI
jgi:hypothetical protein